MRAWVCTSIVGGVGLEVLCRVLYYTQSKIVYDHHYLWPVVVQCTSRDLLSIPTGGAGGT